MPLSLEKVMAMVDGYKSYIIAGAVAITVFAFISGLITREQFESILGLLGAGGLMAVRHAISKMEAKKDE